MHCQFSSESLLFVNSGTISQSKWMVSSHHFFFELKENNSKVTIVIIAKWYKALGVVRIPDPVKRVDKCHRCSFSCSGIPCYLFSHSSVIGLNVDWWHQITYFFYMLFVICKSFPCSSLCKPRRLQTASLDSFSVW